MNIEDLRKLREQVTSGEALVRPESVIVEVIDTAIVALDDRIKAIEAAQHAGKEHAEMEDLLCDLGDKYALGWEEMADIPTAIGARIEELREALEAFYFDESASYATLTDGRLLTPIGKMNQKDFELARKALGLKEKA